MWVIQSDAQRCTVKIRHLINLQSAMEGVFHYVFLHIFLMYVIGNIFAGNGALSKCLLSYW